MGGEHSRKEPFEQLVDSYLAHPQMSLRQDLTFKLGLKISYYYRCQHVVQESGQADQAYQQEQLTAWDPSHLLYTVLLSQGGEFTTASFSVIHSILPLFSL